MKYFMNGSVNHPRYWNNVGEIQILGPRMIQDI